MKRKIIGLVALFLSASAISVSAQNAQIFGKNVNEIPQNPENGIIRCVTSEYESHLQQSHESYSSQDEFEAWLAPKVAEMKELILSGKMTDELINIPVVVHVIHSGQPVGTGANISDLRVNSQITVLNQDYQRLEGTPGYNEHEDGANIGLNFCLAQFDPEGNPTNGINRVEMSGHVWNEANVESILKPQTQWDPTKYLNIWVAQLGGDLSMTLGYAQFPRNSTLLGLPANGTEQTDGVIISWRAFGTRDIAPGVYAPDYDKGTTTHEIGHFLGLRHIWGDNSSCTVNSTDSFQDYCLDTPAAASSNYGCVIRDSCPTDEGNDMTENYMDYSDDICFNLFTNDQKFRIITVLANSPRRKELVTSTVCEDAMSTNDNSTMAASIYPNPVNDFLNVNLNSSDKITSYVIYNSLGQLMMKETTVKTGNFQINTQGLNKGVYIITLYTDKNSSTYKFVKE